MNYYLSNKLAWDTHRPKQPLTIHQHPVNDRFDDTSRLEFGTHRGTVLCLLANFFLLRHVKDWSNMHKLLRLRNLSVLAASIPRSWKERKSTRSIVKFLSWKTFDLLTSGLTEAYENRIVSRQLFLLYVIGLDLMLNIEKITIIHVSRWLTARSKIDSVLLFKSIELLEYERTSRKRLTHVDFYIVS